MLYESQQLLSPLEELEKHITYFYESLEKVNEIISVPDPEVPPVAVFKQKLQVRTTKATMLPFLPLSQAWKL